MKIQWIFKNGRDVKAETLLCNVCVHLPYTHSLYAFYVLQCTLYTTPLSPELMKNKRMKSVAACPTVSTNTKLNFYSCIHTLFYIHSTTFFDMCIDIGTIHMYYAKHC